MTASGGCARASDDPLVALRVTIAAPETVRAGAEARFTLTLANASSRPVSLPLGSDAYAVDIVVRRNGALVWDRLRTAGTLPVEEHVLEPDQRLAFEAGWGLRDLNGHPVAPGEYSVEGLLRGPGGASLSAPNIIVMHVRPP